MPDDSSQETIPVQTPKSDRVTDATTYIVLYTTELDSKWGMLRAVEARSAEAAVRVAVGNEIPDGAASFVAVPSRSWKPVKVTAKVETTLVIEGA